jgi:hypothetical protein
MLASGLIETSADVDEMGALCRQSDTGANRAVESWPTTAGLSPNIGTTAGCQLSALPATCMPRSQMMLTDGPSDLADLANGRSHRGTCKIILVFRRVFYRT